MLHNVDPKNVDFVAPIIAILYHGCKFDEVLLDGGSGVNTLPEFVFKELQIKVKLSSTPFQVKMADQRRFQLLGILQKQVIDIAQVKFSVNFVVLGMKDVDITYRMLLGKPWLK